MGYNLVRTECFPTKSSSFWCSGLGGRGGRYQGVQLKTADDIHAKSPLSFSTPLKKKRQSETTLVSKIRARSVYSSLTTTEADNSVQSCNGSWAAGQTAYPSLRCRCHFEHPVGQDTLPYLSISSKISTLTLSKIPESSCMADSFENLGYSRIFPLTAALDFKLPLASESTTTKAAKTTRLGTLRREIWGPQLPLRVHVPCF